MRMLSISKPRFFPTPFVFHPQETTRPPLFVILATSSRHLAQYSELVTLFASFSFPTFR